MNATQYYIKTYLIPRLKRYGLNKDQRERVYLDVALRLDSIIARWNDVPYRNILLTVAKEEATFWEPRDASLDIRSLVVLGLRNSAIESLNASVRGGRQVLSDEEMPLLTGEAISYFRTVNLGTAEVAKGVDAFSLLPKRFPHAWQCLTALANLDGVEASYALERKPAEPLKLACGTGARFDQAVVASGMDGSIDSELAKLLRKVEKGEMTVFASPSFSRITRNVSKLLSILDHLLRNNATLVTANYVLSPDYVARRSPLLRPPHDADECAAGFANEVGMTHRHKTVLHLAAAD